MQSFVKSLSGKTFRFYVKPSETIDTFKSRIYFVEGLLAAEFLLFMKGDALIYGGVASLSEAGIIAGSQLTLAIACGVDVVCGGRSGMISGYTYDERYTVRFDDGRDDDSDDLDAGDDPGQNWRSASQLALSYKYWLTAMSRYENRDRL